MAKRRNVKKEKAARNRAYAKQFQKKTSRYNPKTRNYENKEESNSSDSQEDSDSSST